jgi:hypothetical protein
MTIQLPPHRQRRYQRETLGALGGPIRHTLRAFMVPEAHVGPLSSRLIDVVDRQMQPARAKAMTMTRGQLLASLRYKQLKRDEADARADTLSAALRGLLDAIGTEAPSVPPSVAAAAATASTALHATSADNQHPGTEEDAR